MRGNPGAIDWEAFRRAECGWGTSPSKRSSGKPEVGAEKDIGDEVPRHVGDFKQRDRNDLADASEEGAGRRAD